MDWWIVGIKFSESDADSLMLLSRKSNPMPFEQGLVVRMDGTRCGRASPGVWVMTGGFLLDTPIQRGNGDDLPDMSGVDPRDLTRRHHHHRC